MRASLVLLILLPGLTGWVSSTTNNGEPLKWNTCDLSFYVNSEGSDDLSLEEIEEGAKASLAPWTSLSCSGLSAVYAGRTADSLDFSNTGANRNVILFREKEEDWEHSPLIIALTTVTFCEQAAGICAFPGAILDADIEMNGVNFTFTHTDRRLSTQYDLANTLTHEFGHFIGLDHSDVEGATMHKSAPVRETSKRDLEQDDIDGVCTLYPAGEECTVPLPAAADEGCDCAVRDHDAPAAPWAWLLLGAGWVLRRRAG